LEGVDPSAGAGGAGFSDGGVVELEELPADPLEELSDGGVGALGVDELPLEEVDELGVDELGVEELPLEELGVEDDVSVPDVDAGADGAPLEEPDPVAAPSEGVGDPGAAGAAGSDEVVPPPVDDEPSGGGDPSVGGTNGDGCPPAIDGTGGFPGFGVPGPAGFPGEPGFSLPLNTGVVGEPPGSAAGPVGAAGALGSVGATPVPAFGPVGVGTATGAGAGAGPVAGAGAGVIAVIPSCIPDAAADTAVRTLARSVDACSICACASASEADPSAAALIASCAAVLYAASADWRLLIAERICPTRGCRSVGWVIRESTLSWSRSISVKAWRSWSRIQLCLSSTKRVKRASTSNSSARETWDIQRPPAMRAAASATHTWWRAWSAR